MITINKRLTRIDSLLDRMAEEIQLDDSRYERMKQSYEAIKNWIDDDEKFFKPYKYDVYPHGSVRIGTTVKPLISDEFDLDIVVHLVADNNIIAPSKVYNELKRRLLENKKYEAILELKNRCWRLNYAGDFHMDVMPGIQETLYDNNKIKVPDRKLNNWVSSNPKGYSDWFLLKANLIKESYLEKALRAEKLPVDDFRHKKPLQRAVQLIKRYRDEYFQKDLTYKTPSIILTTIAGQYYQGEESIFTTIDGIITSLVDQIKLSQRVKIFNPVNHEEDFTDKWDSEPQYYTEFKNFIRYLYQEWQKLKTNTGIDSEDIILKGLFGESVYKTSKSFVDNRFSNTIEVDKFSGLRMLARPGTTEHKMWYTDES
jgi:hypothetical protein